MGFQPIESRPVAPKIQAELFRARMVYLLYPWYDVNYQERESAMAIAESFTSELVDLGHIPVDPGAMYWKLAVVGGSKPLIKAKMRHLCMKLAEKCDCAVVVVQGKETIELANAFLSRTRDVYNNLNEISQLYSRGVTA